MSHRFSEASESRLETCDPRLQDLARAALKRWDFTVIEGHRSKRRQKQLYMAGKSKIDGESRLSKHNHSPSLAMDLAPYPIDWSDKERFLRFGSYVQGLADAMGIPIRWGGDWDGDTSTDDQSFDDLVHFELEV
jgi:peptidoglycan L-alanyl-D-glutamate endopeptidase CwlK